MVKLKNKSEGSDKALDSLLFELLRKQVDDIGIDFSSEKESETIKNLTWAHASSTMLEVIKETGELREPTLFTIISIYGVMVLGMNDEDSKSLGKAVMEEAGEALILSFNKADSPANAFPVLIVHEIFQQIEEE